MGHKYQRPSGKQQIVEAIARQVLARSEHKRHAQYSHYHKRRKPKGLMGRILKALD